MFKDNSRSEDRKEGGPRRNKKLLSKLEHKKYKINLKQIRKRNNSKKLKKGKTFRFNNLKIKMRIIEETINQRSKKYKNNQRLLKLQSKNKSKSSKESKIVEMIKFSRKISKRRQQ